MTSRYLSLNGNTTDVTSGAPSKRIGTKTLRPRGTSPLKGVNPTATPGYRNGTETFFGLKGRPSVVRDVLLHNQPSCG
jgi:hypothetical protein